MAWVVAYFEHSGYPAVGLSPSIRIRYVDTSAIIVEDTMDEVSDGFYKFNFTGYDRTKDYTILADAVSLGTAERYLAGSNGIYGGLSNNIYILADNINYRILLMKKLGTNKLELDDGSVDNWVLYNDDNSTPLLTFSATDFNDEEVFQRVATASKRSKATEG